MLQKNSEPASSRKSEPPIQEGYSHIIIFEERKMAKKNKHKQTQQLQDKRREERIEKGALWASAYQGADAIKDYSKEFCVDISRAIKDLQLIGYGLTQEDIDVCLRPVSAEEPVDLDSKELDISKELKDPEQDISKELKYPEQQESAVQDEPSDDGEEEMSKIEKFLKQRQKREEDWLKAHNKTIEDSYKDFRKAKKIIDAKRASLPQEIIQYHELSKRLKDAAFEAMDDTISYILGDFDWPPEKVIRDKYLEVECYDCRSIFSWRGPYFDEDINWGLWLDNYEAGVPDEENIYKIEPLKILVPDSEMHADFDVIIKNIDAEAAEEGKKIYNWNEKTVEEVLAEFDSDKEEMDSYHEDDVQFYRVPPDGKEDAPKPELDKKDGFEDMFLASIANMVYDSTHYKKT
jgi:hypothetical protein